MIDLDFETLKGYFFYFSILILISASVFSFVWDIKKRF